MASENRFGKFWTRLWSSVVQDVPPALEECETCREVDCTQERWLHCERRLAAESYNLAANAPGRTDDLLPRVLPAVRPAAVPERTPGPNTEDGVVPLRPRKISSD
jgi:hypothetical protein